MTNYTPVLPNQLVDSNLYNSLKLDIQNGITNTVSKSNPIFNNVINIQTVTAGNVLGVANAVLPNDAINVSQNMAGYDFTGIDVGNIIMFHGEHIPKGYAVCDGTIPTDCPLQLPTPKLEPLTDKVLYIIRIY